MIEFKDKPTVYFDVDDTLVLWSFNQHDLEKTIEVGGPDFTQRVLPHDKHIKHLLEHKARGHIVVVWSAGGAEWAASVIKTLGLERHVDITISKPNWFFDDLKPEQFMNNRFYYKNDEV